MRAHLETKEDKRDNTRMHGDSLDRVNHAVT